MIESCEIISDMLIDYVNRSLSKKVNSEVILHLSGCESCRKEIADIIAFSRQMSLQMVDVPADIKISVYEKIPQKEKSLDDIIKSNSIFMAFDILDYVLAPVKKTIHLAMQGI